MGFGQSGALYVSDYVQFTARNNMFVSNTISSDSLTAAMRIVPTIYNIEITASSFYDNGRLNGSGSTVYCGTSMNIAQTNNLFCGPTPNTFNKVDCIDGWPIAPLGTLYDTCGVCNGNDSVRDCSGDCFGKKVRDNAAGCCYEFEKDCAGNCNVSRIV